MTASILGWKPPAVTAVFLLLAAACSRPPTPPNPAPAATGPTAEAYTLGLGEIMGLQQMRHVKLWFAGQAKNWELASYELDELTEGFEDASPVACRPRRLGVVPKARAL